MFKTLQKLMAYNNNNNNGTDQLLNLFYYQISIKYQEKSKKILIGGTKKTVNNIRTIHKFSLAQEDFIFNEELLGGIYHYLKQSRIYEYGSQRKALIVISYGGNEYLTVSPRLSSLTSEVTYDKFMNDVKNFIRLFNEKAYDERRIESIIIKLDEYIEALDENVENPEKGAEEKGNETSTGLQGRKTIRDPELLSGIREINLKHIKKRKNKYIKNPYINNNNNNNNSKK